ncbi:DUF4435 domain-containing protein [Virgibacillus litoralis]|uniref:DUF4435 domain-containing protein n=1 Tax=Virgibacillus litoralis TaxID=578221 RepID=A0ABS4HEJ6_9BACI|nr:DUF4435 domain-containing protein [Virgibacillus litoralis]MBP1949360.1 hypothetical protein [Virgibacillus litoralis]
MKHDLEEWITEAIMAETPVIIVEGHDDIQFYERLIIDMEKDAVVDAVENIEGYNEGSDGVIKCIQDLQPKFGKSDEVKKYILGIIDRDARFYRNEIPNYLGLLILEFYSFESHFITQNNLIELIQNLTYVSKRHVDVKTIGYIEDELYKKDFIDLYYISLEALRNACEVGYSGEVSYGEEAGKIYSEGYKTILLKKIYAKKNDLDEFANSKDITYGDLKKIARGKWILHVFSKYLNYKIKELKKACDSNEINKCNFCLTGVNHKCLWKVKGNFQHGHVSSMITNYVDESEIKYIKERIELLA